MRKNCNLDHINSKQEFAPEEETLIFAGTGLITKSSLDEALGYMQHMQNKSSGLVVLVITRPPVFEEYYKEPLAFQHIDTSHPDYVIIKERDKVINVQLKHEKSSLLERILSWLGIPFLEPYQIDINFRIYYYQEFV
jgi:hypothetical protein